MQARLAAYSVLSAAILLASIAFPYKAAAIDCGNDTRITKELATNETANFEFTAEYGQHVSITVEGISIGGTDVPSEVTIFFPPDHRESVSEDGWGKYTFRFDTEFSGCHAGELKAGVYGNFRITISVTGEPSTLTQEQSEECKKLGIGLRDCNDATILAEKRLAAQDDPDTASNPDENPGDRLYNRGKLGTKTSEDWIKPGVELRYGLTFTAPYAGLRNGKVTFTFTEVSSDTVTYDIDSYGQRVDVFNNYRTSDRTSLSDTSSDSISNPEGLPRLSAFQVQQLLENGFVNLPYFGGEYEYFGYRECARDDPCPEIEGFSGTYRMVKMTGSDNSNSDSWILLNPETGIILTLYLSAGQLASTGAFLEQTNVDLSFNNGGGCLIATAAFGSELAPPVQFLREFRDQRVLATPAGSSFMQVFNTWYYSFSPYVADYERQHSWFQQSVKTAIYPLLGILHLSEQGYGSFDDANMGTITAGTIASSLIGAVYLWPASLVGKRFVNAKSLKLVFLIVLGAFSALLASIFVDNSSLLMATTSAFILSLMSASALLSGLAILKLFQKSRRYFSLG